tara:strand:+ start:16504 stop:17250 length:747 start_codon:yes stop_codon:yes gene_type:complete
MIINKESLKKSEKRFVELLFPKEYSYTYSNFRTYSEFKYVYCENDHNKKEVAFFIEFEIKEYGFFEIMPKEFIISTHSFGNSDHAYIDFKVLSNDEDNYKKLVNIHGEPKNREEKYKMSEYVYFRLCDLRKYFNRLKGFKAGGKRLSSKNIGVVSEKVFNNYIEKESLNINKYDRGIMDYHIKSAIFKLIGEFEITREELTLFAAKVNEYTNKDRERNVFSELVHHSFKNNKFKKNLFNEYCELNYGK